MERISVSKVREIFLSYPGFVPDTEDEYDVYFKSPVIGGHDNTDLCVSVSSEEKIDIYTRFEPDGVNKSDRKTYSLRSSLTFEIDDYNNEETIYCEEEWLHKICLSIIENDKILREKLRREEIQKDFE